VRQRVRRFCRGLLYKVRCGVRYMYNALSTAVTTDDSAALAPHQKSTIAGSLHSLHLPAQRYRVLHSV